MVRISVMAVASAVFSGADVQAQTVRVEAGSSSQYGADGGRVTIGGAGYDGWVGIRSDGPLRLGGAFQTPDSLFFADRAASGWTVRLTLVLAVVPFALGLVDLIVRGRRRSLPFRPALRALRTRLAVALLGGVLLWLGALGGVLPTGAALPLPPFADVLHNPPIGGLLLLAGAFALGWLIARRRLAPQRPTTAEERLAGMTTALTTTAIVAIALTLANPYALVFMLPSLYA